MVHLKGVGAVGSRIELSISQFRKGDNRASRALRYSNGLGHSSDKKDPRE